MEKIHILIKKKKKKLTDGIGILNSQRFFFQVCQHASVIILPMHQVPECVFPHLINHVTVTTKGDSRVNGREYDGHSVHQLITSLHCEQNT